MSNRMLVGVGKGHGGTPADPKAYLILIAGQSNGTGTGATGQFYPRTYTPTWSKTQRMFSSGIRTQPDPTSVASVATGLGSFVALAEADDGATHAQTIAAGMVEYLERKTSKKFVVATHAVDGQRYTAINKGTQPYTNGQSQVTNFKNNCAANSETYRCLCVCLLHGEADQDFLNTSYGANLVTFQGNYNTDSKAITGQSENIPMFLCQMCSKTPATVTVAQSSAKQQIDTSVANPTTHICVGPKYHLHYHVDHLHLQTMHNQFWHGAQYGKVIYRQMFGSGFSPFRMSSAAVTGSTVVVTLTPPNGSIVFDAKMVRKHATWGFTWFDDAGTPVTVTGVAITASNQVTLTLSGAPTGTAASWRVRYGWGVSQASVGGPEQFSGRGNIRDSDTEVSGLGQPLYNWLCIGDVLAV